MNKSYSLQNLNSIAKEIIISAKYKILLFYGEMGVGKTTLIKEICKTLQVKETVNSPTFSLVNEYKTLTGETVYHFDFYRIENEEEAYNIGIEDYLYSSNWCFVEWPDKIESLLPPEVVKINISLLENDNRSIILN